jgi:SAM-dependent methyltransferase
MDGRPQWESRYRARPADGGRPPSLFVVEQCRQLPPGRALDVASGDGRHALYLARRGWAVDAVDFAHAGLARLLAVARRFRDFEILAYHEGRSETESGPAFLAQLLARRPASPPTVD